MELSIWAWLRPDTAVPTGPQSDADAEALDTSVQVVATAMRQRMILALDTCSASSPQWLTACEAVKFSRASFNAAAVSLDLSSWKNRVSLDLSPLGKVRRRG
jgi:hypothetical protein